MTTEVTTHPLDKKEARAFAESIKKRLGDVREMLIELHDRFGWAVLGYKTWEACVKEEFGWDRTYAHRQIAAGRIERKLLKNTPQTGKGTLPIGNAPIPEIHLRPLASLPDDQQAVAYLQAKEIADKESKPLTAKAVQAVVDMHKAANDAMKESFDPPPDEPEEEEDPTTEERMAVSNKALESFARQIGTLQKQARELSEPHLDDRIEDFDAKVRTLAGIVRVSKGAAVCSYCKDGEGCRSCRQSGWLTKVQAESAPEK